MWLSGPNWYSILSIEINIMVTIKLIHRGLHTKYISPFIGGVPLGIYRKGIIPLLQSKQVLEQLLSSPPGLGITSCVSGSCIDICICLVVSCGSYINPNVFFHAAIFKSKETAPKLVTLTIHFSKGPSGSWWYQSTKWSNSFTTIFLVSVDPWFLPSPHADCLLGEQRP